jgi:hypothetical protein
MRRACRSELCTDPEKAAVLREDVDELVLNFGVKPEGLLKRICQERLFRQVVAAVMLEDLTEGLHGQERIDVRLLLSRIGVWIDGAAPKIRQRDLRRLT